MDKRQILLLLSHLAHISHYLSMFLLKNAINLFGTALMATHVGLLIWLSLNTSPTFKPLRVKSKILLQGWHSSLSLIPCVNHENVINFMAKFVLVTIIFGPIITFTLLGWHLLLMSQHQIWSKSNHIVML